jgi:hypothetical protein
MKKVLSISILGAASVVAGIGLLSFSPISCACVDELNSLLRLAGLDYSDPNKAQDYDALQIAAGLNRHMKGRQMTPGQPHQYFVSCTRQSETEFTCTVPVKKSFLLTKSYQVTVTTGDDRRLVKAGVDTLWSWL